jgi:acyl phosphate:glycerol-3-phosphate acyltransferase
VIELLLKGGLSYLLGSIVGSLIVGRLKGGVDIRTLGSGNAGATNALRTLGKSAALGVFVIDVAKGWAATGLIAPWVPVGASWGPAGLRAWSVPVCGLAVMLGHIYPVWFGFRGGKAVATFAGALIGIGPLLLVPFVLTWLAAVVVYGFVSLASILAAVAVGVTLGLSRWQPRAPLVAFGVLAALLILFTHRSNIQRIREGRESRARRLWRFGTRRGTG